MLEHIVSTLTGIGVIVVSLSLIVRDGMLLRYCRKLTQNSNDPDIVTKVAEIIRAFQRR